MSNNHCIILSPCVTVRPPRPAGSAPEPPARPSLASPLDVRHATTESTVAPVVLPRDRIPRWKRRYYRPAPAHPSSTKGNTKIVHAPESENPVKTPAQDEGHNKPSGARSDKPVNVTGNTRLVCAEVHAPESGNPVKTPAQDEGHDKPSGAGSDKPVNVTGKTPAQDEGHDKLSAAGSDKPVKVTGKTPAQDEGHDKPSAAGSDKPVKMTRNTRLVHADVHAPASGNPVKTPAQDEGHNKVSGAGSDKPVNVTGKTPTQDEGHDKLSAAGSDKPVKVTGNTQIVDAEVHAPESDKIPAPDHAHDIIVSTPGSDKPVNIKSKSGTRDQGHDRTPTDNVTENIPAQDQGEERVSTTTDKSECKAETPGSTRPVNPDVTVINIPPRPSPGFYEPDYGDALFVRPEDQIYENTIPGVFGILPVIARDTRPMTRVGPHDTAKRRIRLLLLCIILPAIIGSLGGWSFSRYILQPGNLTTVSIIIISALFML